MECLELIKYNNDDEHARIMFHHKSAVLLNKKQDQITSQHRIPSAELQQNYSTNFLLNIDNVFLISREWPDTFGVA